MSKVKLYTQNGKEKGYLDLPEEVFDVPMNKDLLYQAVRVFTVRKRKTIADTKTRSEVRGGGKKPWRQKGTGRARHGSIRAPQWRGGGVVFGPTSEKIYTAKLPLKMKKKATCIALSAKVRDGEVMALDSIKLDEAKTKYMAEVFNNLMSSQKGKNRNTLLVLKDRDEVIFRATRNLQEVDIKSADQVNLLDILSKKFLIVTPDSISILQKRFG